MMKRLKDWWSSFRGETRIVALAARVVALEAKKDELTEKVRLAEVEIEDLKKRLETERAAHVKSRRHMEKLWRFIAVRHRVDIPAEPGTIRQILQKAEGR